MITLDDWRRAEPILTRALLRPQTGAFDSSIFEEAIRSELLAVLQRTSTIFPVIGSQLEKSSDDDAVPLPEPPPVAGALLVGGQDLADGRFTIVRELGRGGMGEVYLAHDRRLGGLVALKTLFEPQLREAQHARLCSGHPHIATMHDVFETTISDRSVTVLVMEYIAGKTANRLIQDGPVPLGEVVRWMRQVAGALAHAHDHEVVHCDLKPANILIAADGAAKVLDFGIGRRTFDKHVPDQGWRGTLPYMAPEQVLEGRYLPAGDIYSLGVTLFELVTGRLPFDAEVPELLLQVVGAPVPPISNYRADVPQRLDEILECALSKEPLQRYRSARAFDQALELLERDIALPRATAGRHSYAPPNRYRSLAVLPFTNTFDAADDPSIAEAVTSEIITKLARLKGMLVISRSGTERYRNSALPADEIGRELGVETVLEGSISKVNDRWRITVQLLEVEHAFCVWADVYEFAAEDLFRIQDTVPQRIARALRARFRGNESSSETPAGINAEAYRLYLQGKALYYRFNSTDNALAADAFRRAIALEPRYAAAHAALASACMARLEREWEPDEARWVADAMQACARAVALDPWNADAYSARGFVFLRQGRPAEAETELRRALNINANDDTAHGMLGRVLFERGDLGLALRSFKRALKISPDYVWCWNDLAWVTWLMGRFAETERALARVLTINPVDEVARVGIATGLYFSGQLDAAAATAEKSIEINPSHPYSRPVLAVVLARQGRLREAEMIAQATLEQHPTEFLMNAAVGVMYAIADDAQKLRDANDRALAIRALRTPLNVNVAVHYAFLGRADYARLWLQKACREGMDVDDVLKHNPLLRQFGPEFPTRRGRGRRPGNADPNAALFDVDQGN